MARRYWNNGDGRQWDWRLAGALAAGVLVVAAAVGGFLVVHDGGKSPATEVLSEAITAPTTTAPGPTGGGAPEATTTTTTALAAAAPTTAPARSGATGGAATTTTTRGQASGGALVCRNSTDPRCGPFRWETVLINQPMTLQLAWSPQKPVVGQPVTFTLTASDPDAPAPGGSSSLSFGDGSALVADAAPPPACDRYGPWSVPAPEAGRWVRTYTHIYQATGTYTAAFSETSMTPGLPGCVDAQRALGDPWASALTIRTPITVANPPVPQQFWIQPSDNSASFGYHAVGERNGASSMLDGAGSGVLLFEVQGNVIADSPPTARLRATLHNQRSFAVTFGDGLDVIVHVARDGLAWQDVHLSNPNVTSLGPGQDVEVAAPVLLPGFGDYSMTAEVTYASA